MTQVCDCGQLGVLLTFSAWGPGGPGAPALPGNPGGPYINKGVGRMNAGLEGCSPPLPAACAPLLRLSINTTQERGVRRPAGPGPTQEALLSRSWLLESGLATQAAPPVLPSPPQAHAAVSGLVKPAPSRWNRIRQAGFFVSALTGWPGKPGWP